MLAADHADLEAAHERTHAAFVHGGRRVVLGMFTPSGIPVAHSLALLDGDEIDESTYAVAVSRLAGTDDEVYALAVARPAPFTALEREVLRVVPTRFGAGRGAELGFWTEGFVARFAADLAERAIDWAANEIGIADEIHAVQNFVGQVEHAAQDIIGAGVDAVDGVLHGLAQAAGIDGIIQAGEDVVGAVVGAVNAVDNAVNNVVDAAAGAVADAAGAVVNAAADVVGDAAKAVGNAVDAAADAVGDAVGAAVDWVADNIFGGIDANLQDQFEQAAIAQRTFQRLVTTRVETDVTRLETVRPAASLGQLLEVRTQVVTRAAVNRPRLSLLRRGPA